MTLITSNTEAKVQSSFDTILESTQDFTDSAYTSHENRERILVLCDRIRHEITSLLLVGNSLVSEISIVLSSDYIGLYSIIYYGCVIFSSECH